MKLGHAPPTFPEGLPGDEDDLARALSTGAIEWNRGAYAEALAWLERAIETARQGGRKTRARDLGYQQRTLEMAVEAGWVSETSSNLQNPANSEGDPRMESPSIGTDDSLSIDIQVELEELAEEDLIEFDDAEVEILSSDPPPIRERALTLPEAGVVRPLASNLAGNTPREEEESTAQRPGATELLRVLSRFERPASSNLPTSDPLSAPGSPSPPRRQRSPLPPPRTRPSAPSPPRAPRPPSSLPLPRFPSPSDPPASDPPPAMGAPAPPEVAGVLLSSVVGLRDLPEEAQARLAHQADIRTLSADEGLEGFALALLIEGSVGVMPAVADVTAAEVERGEPIVCHGHVQDGVAIRAVAGVHGARVAVWTTPVFEAAIANCPEVSDQLRSIGDRFQTLAGVSIGLLGEQLDDMLRALVIGRCEMRRLAPGEVIAHAGKPLTGLVVLGAGRIEIFGPGQDLDSLGPGDFLFAQEILRASPAPANARAGAGGALVLFAERRIAHELMLSVPPLLGIFAR